MLAFMDDPMANRAWVYHGGLETLVSYGVQPPPSIGATDEDWQTCAQGLKAKLPATHLAFLTGLERYVVMGDYLFVHAGVEVSKSLEEQSDQDIYWSRLRWLNNKRRFTHKVVHGHTPAEKPYIDERRVGVDTGAYASGVLTAARFEGEAVTFFAVSANQHRLPEGKPKAKKSRF
jgi:serine/threonine protein phosphatase 1